MKKYIFMTALLGLALPNIATAEDATPIRLGALKVYPVLDVEESYDDNIFAQETVKTSSWITTVKPSVKVVAESGTSKVEVNYQLSSGSYHSSSDDNYIDHFVDAKTTFGLTRRLNIDLWADYKQTHDKRGATFTGGPIVFNAPDEYHQITAGGKVSYGVKGRIDLTGEYSSKRYDNHPTRTLRRDYDTMGGSAAFSFPIAPKTLAVIEARYKRFDYQLFSATTNLDSVEQRYFAGLDWAATTKTTGKVRLGYLMKNFSNSLLTDGTQFSWELGMIWKPMTYSSWTLTTSSRPVETDSSAGVSYIESTSGNLRWKHDWTSYFSHSASAGYASNRYEGSARRDKVSKASISLDYQMLRWLSVGTGYEFTNRNSNNLNSSYRQNVYSFNVKGTL